MFNQSQFYNESYVMTQIDAFIRKVAFTGMIFKDFTQSLFELIKPFKFHYKQELSYSLSIQLFAQTVSTLDAGLELDKDVNNYKKIQYLDNIDIRVLILDIREKRALLKSEWQNCRNQEEANKQSLKEYLAKLTQHYSKLLFVRVDLYLNEVGETDVSIVEYVQYMKILRNRLSNKDGCFSGLQGYAWAIEQGEQRGYHCHLLLIYDGHQHQNDCYLGLQVGKYWQKLVKDGASFFTSNHSDYKEKFKNTNSLGIGMIHRNNPIEVENAIKATMYLVSPEKDNQFLRVKVPKMKTFGMGMYNVSWRRGI